MAISTIAKIERLHNVHGGSPQTAKHNPPQITKFYSMIFKQQLTDISTVLNNTGNTTKLLTSFNALDISQQKVLLSSSLLSEKQKEQCITMAALSAANTKYTAEQLAKATGISTETLANLGLIESTDALTISELAQRAASDAQAKAVLDKIIAQNAEAVANGKIIASNTALTASEGGATLATGAFTTAIKANIKAMITWITTTPLGWLTMLVGGVFLAVKAYDALTVSVKEQKEKMEDSLSAYKDAKSELSNITTEIENQEQAMDDLLAKEKLTYAEQGQLEELQAITRELRIQKDLAEKEEERTQKEVAKEASDLFNKQFGKYDISEDAISEYQNNANITGNNAILISNENNISSMIAGYRQFNDLLDEAYVSENQEDIDHFKSLTEGLKDSIFEKAQELQEQQSNIADYYNTIKDIPYDDLTTEQKKIVDSYNSISDAIELIYQQLDSNTWKSMQIESVFDTEGIEKTKEELIEMVKAGEFDESTLQSYPKLSAALEQNKVSASELCNELEALADAEGNVKGDTFNDKNPISIDSARKKLLNELNDESANEWINSISSSQASIINSTEFEEALENQKEKLEQSNTEIIAGLEDRYSEARQTIADEYQKISELGLDDYADDIKSGAIQSQFGNVDMDKRTIIEWSDELKQTYADALASWDYEPEIGSIDSVLGKSDRFGEDLNGIGWEIAFTPILPNGTLIDKDTVYEYINTILEEAYSNDGKLTEDELRYIDLQGRQIGDTFVKGIFAGIDDSQNYENNGNWADTVSRMMQFSGDSGSIGYVTNHINNELVPAIDNAKENLDNVTLSAENYSKALEEAQNKIAEASFDQAWADLVASEDDAVKELDADLLGLAEKGRLTVDTFNEADSTGYFKNLGISADIAVSKINKLVDESKQLSSMSDQISKMSEALGTKRENGFVEADTLSSFDVEVRGLDSWDEFQNVLGSTTSSYKECRQAANNLATEWVNSNNFLSQLTEENKEYYETKLREMGVANAQEIVYDALNKKTEELALEKQFLAQTGIDVANATEQDIQEYIAETGASAECAQSLMVLALKKAAVNGVLLDTSADISNLLSLAKAAGIATDNLSALAYAKSGLALAEEQGNEPMVSYYNDKIKELGKKAEEDIFNFEQVEVDFGKIGGGKSSAGSAGKEAADEYLEAFEKELKDLDELKDAGLITEKQYLDRLRVLYNKYFRDKKQYLKQYAKYEKQYLDGMKGLYEKAFSHMTSQLDKRIDGINAERDARLADIDAQKEQYQNEIDLIDEQIKAKNKEIETIRSANKEKEEALNLQKSQYELERMQNQRTNLVYTEDKGIIYRPDLKNIRDAKQNVEDAQMEITISKIEKETELLENQKEMWEGQIDLLDRQADALEKYYDSMIEAIEEQKSKFEELQNLLEEAEMSSLLKELEINEEALLSGSTEEFNKLRDAYIGIIADMNKGNEGVLSALSELSGMSTLPSYLGDATYSINEFTDSTNNLSNSIVGIDPSNATGALDNTAQASSNAAEKVQTVTTALNNLSNDVSNYQMPAINTDNFTSAFTEDGGILSALNGFMERYKEICDSIPDIWNNSLAEAFGQGGGSGDPLAGGLANGTKYDALFSPMLDALDNCKNNLEDKLKECLGTFTSFQSDLSGIIGVGGGSEGSGTSQSGAGGGKGKTSSGEKGSGGNKKPESGGSSDTIVGAIVEGGGLIDQALNGEEDSWSASFNTAKDSIHETATSIVDCIESMVETVVDACIKAIEAINMLASADDNNPNNPTPSPYGKVGHAHAAGINGTKTDEKDAIVSEYGQREMTVFPNGKTVITDSPTAMDLPKGSVVYNEEQTEKILKNKVTATGNAHADGTDADGWITLADGRQIRPLQPGDRTYDMIQKVNAYLKRIDGNVEKLVPNSFYEQNREWNKLADQISYVSSVTNNRNVQQPIHNEIHVTLPNVTNATSAESLLKDLESIGRKKYQVNW